MPEGPHRSILVHFCLFLSSSESGLRSVIGPNRVALSDREPNAASSADYFSQMTPDDLR
jgi:hypothetical protein